MAPHLPSLPNLKKHHAKALKAHMTLHLEHTAFQYSSWAKYALKIDLSSTQCSDLFMDWLDTGEISANGIL